MATNIHPELLKLYNSPNYRKKIKRMIETAKTHHGMLDSKVPRRAKLSKSNPSDKELQEFNKKNTTRLDKECLHYFAQPNEPGQERRISRQQSN
jgi:hypothetical protein